MRIHRVLICSFLALALLTAAGTTLMGTLIATAQATLDGVIDPVGEWVQPDGAHGEHSFERQARSAGLVLGRKTYEVVLSFGSWPYGTKRVVVLSRRPPTLQQAP